MWQDNRKNLGGWAATRSECSRIVGARRRRRTNRVGRHEWSIAVSSAGRSTKRGGHGLRRVAGSCAVEFPSKNLGGSSFSTLLHLRSEQFCCQLSGGRFRLSLTCFPDFLSASASERRATERKEEYACD